MGAESDSWEEEEQDEELEKRGGAEESLAVAKGQARKGKGKTANFDAGPVRVTAGNPRQISNPGEVSTSPQPLHLNNNVWQIISQWAHHRTEGIGFFAQHREVFNEFDYLFLLEAMRCESEAMANLSQACIRLYLLVRRYNALSEDHEVYENFFDSLFEEDRANSEKGRIRLVFQHVERMIQSQRAKMQQAEDQPDTPAWSVSRLTVSPVLSHGHRRSITASSFRSLEEAGQSQPQSSGLEPGFRTKPSKWFSLGRVFIMLWHENDTGDGRLLKDPGAVSPGPYGEKIHTKVRRFAVVRARHGFSWAVPVNTYKSQGVARPGFNADDWEAHAIIHMEDSNPASLPGEPPMSKTPIAVTKTSEDQKLHPASRIRFDKVFSIEHNVKVKNVGKITEKSLPWFRYYWQMEAEAASAAVKATALPT